MTLNLCVLTPNQIIWDSEVKEIILSTNSGQIGVLPNHAPIVAALDIGLLRIRLNDQWLTVALMGDFARIGNNEITILGKHPSTFPHAWGRSSPIKVTRCMRLTKKIIVRERRRPSSLACAALGRGSSR